MQEENLIEVFNLVKGHEDELGESKECFKVEDDKDLIYQLTLRIAYACKEESEFLKAVLEHRYPPIRLTQIEAEFLKAGSLPIGIINSMNLFR